MRLSEIAATMDPVEPAVSLRALLDQHRTVPPLTKLEELVRRHKHSNRRTERFLTLNTFLMDIPGKGRKPAVERRDREIGAYTSRRYDLVTFCEVWHPEERGDLLDEWPDNIYQISKLETDKGKRFRKIGGNAGQMTGSSGLLTVARSLPIVANHFHEYDNESGEDKRADKGCLLTVHELPFRNSGTPSSLNVYNTHLNAAGRAKYAQIIELAEFIWRTKDKAAGNRDRPGRDGLNGCILAGDFNLDRHGSDAVDLADLTQRADRSSLPRQIVAAVAQTVDENGRATGVEARHKSGYDVLSDLLAVLGFTNLWATRNRTRGDTSDLMAAPIARLIARPDPANPALCDDRLAADDIEHLTRRPAAIDHIFVTPTTQNMNFTMDFVRPRRPLTLRPEGAADRDKIAYLSDHLGITTQIILAPKAA